MVDGFKSVGDVGKKVVPLHLTVDEVSFIVCGLRDCAKGAERRSRKWFTAKEDRQTELDIRDENLHLADYLEATYLAVLQG